MKFNLSFLKSKTCIRFFQISGIILAVIIILLLVIPCFININKHKASILDKVNSNLNGSIDFEDVSLSLITGPKFKVKNFNLKDEKDTSIISIDTLYFNIPILSIVTFSPKIILDINHPDIKIIQNKNNLNISNIVKQSSNLDSKDTQKDNDNKNKDNDKDNNKDNKSNNEDSAIVNLIKRSSYTLLVNNASFSFKKDGKELIYLHDLSFVIKNLSLIKNSEFDISTNINFKKDTISIQGPVSILGKLNPNDEEKTYGLSININFKKLLYNISDILVKKASDDSSGISADLNINLASKFINIENINITIPDLSIKTSGTFSFNNEGINLKNNIVYKKNKSDISLDNLIVIKDSKYNIVSNISSNLLNLNSFLPKKATGTNDTNTDTDTNTNTKASESKNIKSQKSIQDQQKGSESTQPIDIEIPPILKDITLTVKTNIKKLSYDKINVTNIITNTNLKNLNLNSNVNLNLFKSKITSSISAKLSKTLPYEAKINISSLDLKDMVSSVLPTFKNTLEGILNFNTTTSGSISKDILATTTSKGTFSVEKPLISTLDSREILDKALKNSIEKIKSKYSYDLTSLPNYNKFKENLTKQKFESDLLTASFSLKDKKVVIPSFILKATPNKGIDINGNADINLDNKDLLSSIILIDTYNLTKASDLSVNKEGVVIDNLLTKEDKIFKVPVNIECKINAPCYKYDKSSKYLMDIVEAKSKSALKKKGKELFKKEAEKLKKEFFFLK